MTRADRHPALLVPTLAAIARRKHLSAFTLVELMVAVAISSIIVLTAVSCFRMVTKAIASANTLSTENSLLRSGFLLAIQDVDYWHSHADANAPYNKGFMRQQARLDNPATNDGGGDSICENTWRRPFQPVRYAPRTDTAERDPFPAEAAPFTGVARDCGYYNDALPTVAARPEWDNDIKEDYFSEPYNRNDYLPNPNSMLAHDPRSYSRMSPLPPQVQNSGTVSNPYHVLHYGGTRMGYTRLAIGDYALVSATDMRDPALAGVEKRYPINDPAPAGLTTIKNFEFALAPGAVADTTTNTIDIPLDNGWGMYQPLLWTSLFQRLNYFGAFEYMTPGTALLWTDRHGTTSNLATLPLPPFTYRRNGQFQPQGANWFQYVMNGDYCFNLGTCDLAVRMGERFMAAPANGGRDARTPEAIPLPPCYPVLNGSYDQGCFDRWAYRSPFAILLGTGDFDWNASSEAANENMRWLMGINFVMERADMTRSDVSSTSTTVWLPYNTTDYERCDPIGGTSTAPTTDVTAQIRPLDYTTKPIQAPVMKTSIMRYGRVAGSQDLTVTRVTVEDPVTARKVELTCMPFGTTFRGARQHWRLYSAPLTPQGPIAPGHRFANSSDACIGDFYDTGAGPYYVP